MKCTVCDNEYESKRSDSKYCSSTCRSKASRATDSDATDNIATDNPVINATDKCHSVIGDKFCSCGQRIHAVLHPVPPHEVQLTKSTRHLHSYFCDYQPIKQPDVLSVQ